jgi:hypothetical protein
MTAVPSIDPAQFLTEQLDQASPDLLRDLLTTFVNALLGARADAVWGAGYGERNSDRVNSRNGYRHCDLDTRLRTIDVAVPKLRQGSLYPDWLLERRANGWLTAWSRGLSALSGTLEPHRDRGGSHDHKSNARLCLPDSR